MAAETLLESANALRQQVEAERRMRDMHTALGSAEVAAKEALKVAAFALHLCFIL